MRLFQAAAGNLRVFGVLLATVSVAFIALGLGIGFSLTAADVFASHDDPTTVHACVSRTTGAARIVNDPEQCTRYERLVEWQRETDTSGLEARIAALEAWLAERDGHLWARNAHRRAGSLAD